MEPFHAFPLRGRWREAPDEVLPPLALIILSANASLGRDGQQRIAQLGHYRAQKVQLVVVQRICEGVGYGGDEGCQFAWIHK